MAPRNWERRRYNDAGGPVDVLPRPSAPPGQILPGDPAGLKDAQGWIITRQVPEQAPPPNTSFFSLADTQAIVGAGTTALFPNLTFVTDPDRFGVIKSLDLEVTDYTKVSNVRFALLLNGIPARGLDNILVPPAVASFKAVGFDLSVTLGRSTQIDVRVTDVDGGPYTVNASVFGWQWPAALDAKYRPEGQGVR